ncbi:PREDICTED: insulin-like peptide INSL5 [Chinchilla lanigera]|uniref:Insulin-like domain-containing protein n=1 Tax=Chinchilla lanigera TaxID=34839 RepID=A0A8C2V1X9_CHILA|nr:PREDICTED: insulin-like peptide INSL5 [Chinchilla lanigera]
MKGSVLALCLLSALVAAAEARAADTVKLCGLEYVRTVVYMCATARWRRHAEGAPPALPADRRNYFQLSNRHEASEENLVHNLEEVDFSGDEHVRDGQMPVEKRHSVMSRRDLQTRCCTAGCSMTELSALC